MINSVGEMVLTVLWALLTGLNRAASDSGWCSEELTCCTNGADCSTASYHFYNTRASVSNHMAAVCLSGTLKYCWARVRTSLIKTGFCIRKTKRLANNPTCSASWLLRGAQLFFLLSAGPLSSAACPPLRGSTWEPLAPDRLLRGTRAFG